MKGLDLRLERVHELDELLGVRHAQFALNPLFPYFPSR